MTRSIILTIISILIYSIGFSQEIDFTNVKLNKVQKTEQVFQSMKNNGFTGCLLVAEKGKIIYSGSHGFTNLLDSVPINENTMFELASVSKQFTATGIALLEQEGIIDVKLPISEYIPELFDYQNISVEQLIHHTSGLPEYEEGDWIYDRSGFITNDSIINYLSRIKPPLLFRPGTQHQYCNTGYVILASIIERVTETTFEEYLRENIFDVAGMSRTTIYRPRFHPETIENHATGFVFSDSLQKNIIPDEHQDHDYIVHLDGIQGDGMVNSTVLDLLKWDRLLYTDRVLSNDTKRKVFSTYRLPNGSENEYGYGWVVEQDELFGKVVSHAGGWPGYVTFIERYMDSDKTIIILQNNYNNASLNTKQLRSILHDSIIPKNKLNNLVGKYEFEDDKTVLDIRVKKDTLVGEYDGDIFKLIQIKENVFFIQDQQYVEIEFKENASGNPSVAKWYQEDYIGILNRIE